MSWDNQDNVIETIEEFVKHYYNGDYVISRDAFSVPCTLNERKESLGNFLTGSLTNYMIAKVNKNSKQIANYMTELIMWMTQLRGAGLITESKSLLSKLESCKDKLKTSEQRLLELGEQNDQLKDNKEKLETKLSRLQNENEELHKALDLFGVRFGDRSTVEKD